jgi:hypothetical protein
MLVTGSCLPPFFCHIYFPDTRPGSFPFQVCYRNCAGFSCETQCYPVNITLSEIFHVANPTRNCWLHYPVMLSAIIQTSCILRQNNFELTSPAEAGKVCLHNLSTSPVLFPKEKGFANPPQQYTETKFRCNDMFTASGLDLNTPFSCSSFQAGTPVRI